MDATIPISHIVKRDGHVVPFDQDKITTAIYKAAASVGGHNWPLSRKLSNQVVSILNECFGPDGTPTVEEIQDVVEKVLIENGHAKTAKAYIVYRDRRARLRREDRKRGVYEPLPYKVMWRTLVWNIDHGVDTVEGLSEKVKDGSFPQLVEEAEAAFNESIEEAATHICKYKDEVRIIIVAGPSSSGKTTTTAKMTERLRREGLDPIPINLDNYFFDLDLHPKDDFGDYDFETPEALDLPLINEHLVELLKGKTVQVPRYDFKAGIRLKETDSLKLLPGQMLLIDNLHGLYEPMTESIPPEAKFKLYIETISQLRDKDRRFSRWADVRLLRRMIRDHLHRAYDPKRTIAHWHYVRRSELKHIIPYIHQTDFILNGALPYELPVLKKYLVDYFPRLIELWENDSHHQDAYIRAKRVYDLLNSIETAKDDSCVPDDSLLREFIGGSVYE